MSSWPILTAITFLPLVGALFILVIGLWYLENRRRAAQARGDLQVLAERGRRHLRIHFVRGAAAGWSALERALD